MSQVLFWDDHSWVVSRIRTALSVSKPPTAFILEDPTHTEWDDWDIKLANALTLYDNLLRGSVPIYWDESDRVRFDVGTGVSKSKAAVDRREAADEKKNKDGKNPNYGVYYYPIPKTIDGGDLPTMEEWMEEKKRKQGKGDKVPTRRVE